MNLEVAEIKCHNNDSFALLFKEDIVWRPARPEREPYGEEFRTCGFCGCIHPQDLLHMIDTHGAQLEGTDWKYGWPHKFYVEGIPNPHYGNKVRSGSGGFYGTSVEDVRQRNKAWELRNIRRAANGENYWDADIYSDAPKFSHAKWYNIHLLDLDDSTFETLAVVIHGQTNIRFRKVGDDIEYEAPYKGYQK